MPGHAFVMGHSGPMTEETDLRPDLTDDDLRHLRRCVELAREALDAGDAPFGSVLVTADGRVVGEDHNREHSTGDDTRHPEFELARLAATALTAQERAGATVYTSGEHCPMCSAAHGWMGLGRIVYAVSSEQLLAWRQAWGSAELVVNVLPINAIAPHVPVDGPAPELEEELRALHRAAWERSQD